MSKSGRFWVVNHRSTAVEGIHETRESAWQQMRRLAASKWGTTFTMIDMECHYFGPVPEDDAGEDGPAKA